MEKAAAVFRKALEGDVPGQNGPENEEVFEKELARTARPIEFEVLEGALALFEIEPRKKEETENEEIQGRLENQQKNVVEAERKQPGEPIRTPNASKPNPPKRASQTA